MQPLFILNLFRGNFYFTSSNSASVLLSVFKDHGTDNPSVIGLLPFETYKYYLIILNTVFNFLLPVG
jgi:hypothetical protein